PVVNVRHRSVKQSYAYDSMVRARRSSPVNRKRPRAAAPNRRALIIGSEAVPFAKTGGLADVLGALPSALARLGWDATVAVPRYHGVAAGALVETFPVTVGGY